MLGRAGGYAARRSSPIPSSKRPMRSRLIVGCVAIPSLKRPMRSRLIVGCVAIPSSKRPMRSRFIEVARTIDSLLVRLVVWGELVVMARSVANLEQVQQQGLISIGATRNKCLSALWIYSR